MNDSWSWGNCSWRSVTQGKGLKILTPQQPIKKLPIELAQVKADNTSGDLRNEI